MKLSIIIPVYNTSAYLESNFKKLLPVYNMLDDKEFEIIYINDGSTDDSGVVLDKIKERKSNITVIHQENQGSSGARNSGIDIAKGEYVQFLDSDDYIDWDKVIPLLETALSMNLDAISYRLDYVDIQNNTIGERAKQDVPHKVVITGEDTLIAGFNPSSICVFLFKTKFLNKNNLRITPKIAHMDVEFTSRFMMVAKKVMFRDVIAYHYLQTENSITRPKTVEKLKKLLTDEIIVAHLVRENINKTQNKLLIQSIEKNYNSIVWNLLWRFYKNKDEVSYDFKRKCLVDLRNKDLYPIKGKLKTPFQKLTRKLFNQSIILKLLIKN